MKPSGQLNHAGTDQTDLEFALETQSGFLVVVKGSGNDGRVTLAVRRRVGTPPASAIALTPNEVKRLVNLLAELSPSALKDKLVVGRARDSYLDDLMGSHNEPEDAEFSLFIERDFPELAKRKRTTPKSFLSGGLGAGLGNTLGTPREKIGRFFSNLPLSGRQIAIAASILVVVAVVALSTVALLQSRPFGTKSKTATTAVEVSPTAAIEDFSRSFVIDMLTFKKDLYRQAQVSAMAKMSPDLAQKYWQETGFPLTRAQLKSIPQDQEIQITQVATLPFSASIYQVDVNGAIVNPTAKTNLPLHIRLTVNKDSQGKLTVIEQKDLSSAATK